LDLPLPNVANLMHDRNLAKVGVEAFKRRR
jgi:hypothetical protein